MASSVSHHDEAEHRAWNEFRRNPVLVVASLTGILGFLALFPRVIGIRTDSQAPSFPTGDWFIADLGTNLPAALLLAIATLVAGSVIALSGRVWGYGLIGGAGLATTGWAALVIARASQPIGRVHDALAIPVTQPFSATITRDLGFSLSIALAVAGLTCAVLAIRAGRSDRLRSLNPWVAALGALAIVVAAVGPLIPLGSASVLDNLDPGPGLPVITIIGRLVQLGLLAIGGVVGFLLVRPFGLGLVAGSISVSAWLTLSTALDFGNSPIGPGITNPGRASGSTNLHAVTALGMAAAVIMLVIATVLAAQARTSGGRDEIIE